MSSTDELRQYARHLHNVWYDPLSNVYTYTTMDIAPSLDAIRLDEHVLAIADRIDAEHEEALREAYTKGCEDGMGMANAKDAQAEYLRGKNDGYDEGWDAGFASADDWLAQHEDAMADHGWVRLPLDADGVPIRIGDGVMHKSLVKPVVVVGVGNDDFFYQKGAGFNWFFHAHEVHHYHAPTVEDVLTKMLEQAVGYSDAHTTVALNTIAEYAAKLRLANDGKEQ